MAVRPRFDPKRQFVAARGFTFMGTEYGPGAPFPAAGADPVDPRLLAQQYGSRAINFAPEAVDDERIQFTSLGGGYYEISAPWLAEPIKARGKADAEAQLAKVREIGEPDTYAGVQLTEGENGWWDVLPIWADAPFKVHGADAARAKAAQLRAIGEVDPVAVDPGEEEGTYTVQALWADEPESAESEDAAHARAQELRAEGPPDDWQPQPATE